MKKYLTICLFCLTILGCKKPVKVIDPPTKAVLSLPLNNEACISGTIISSTQSSVLFKWTASQNTESYELTVKNLESGVTTTQTSTTTELAVPLARNTPYSWFVTDRKSVV